MYNRDKAVEYAKEWALKRNPKYTDFENMGGDCTNYVSQCLFAGGVDFLHKENGWYYYSLNSRAPSWTGVDELFNFAILNKETSGPKFKLCKIYEIELGDIIQLKVGKNWTHSLIVTKITKPKSINNIYICSHSADFFNRQLSKFIFNNIRFCKIYDDGVDK